MSTFHRDEPVDGAWRTLCKKNLLFLESCAVVSMNKGFLNKSDEVTTLNDQRGFYDLKI